MKIRSDKVLVSRRLLYALSSHAIRLAQLRVQANASDAYHVVESVLVDAAEAKLLIERQNGKRR